MPFTGTTAEIAFKQKLHRVLEKNELNGESAYALRWAGTANSGWSFGVPQWDLSVGSTFNSNLFLDILLNATDSAGNFVIDDGDAATARGTPANILDTAVNTLWSKAQLKGGVGPTDAERTLVNQALASAYGRDKIDSAEDTYFIQGR